MLQHQTQSRLEYVLDCPAWSTLALPLPAATSFWTMIAASRRTASPRPRLVSSASGPGARGPRLAGVVGAAPGALLPQHVEPHARGRAAVVAQDPYLHPQSSVRLFLQLQQQVLACQTTAVENDAVGRRTRFRERARRSASYHLLLVDVRHWRRGNLLIELPPRGGHVAGGPRANRAREAASDQTRLSEIMATERE